MNSAAPTYVDMHSAIDHLTDNAMDDWSIPAKVAAKAKEWLQVLELLGVPCPKIFSMDTDGLVLVWGALQHGDRCYLIIDEDSADILATPKMK